jgi:hypothetical protein
MADKTGMATRNISGSISAADPVVAFDPDGVALGNSRALTQFNLWKS